MNSNIFKWIWRVNGVVMAVLLLILMWFLWAEVFSTRLPNTDRGGAPQTALNPNAAPEENLWDIKLRAPLSTGMPGLYALPLVLETDSKKGAWLSSGSSLGISNNSVINYKVVDATAETTQWLFDSNVQVILETKRITHRRVDGSDWVLGYVLRVVDSDTNQNGRLSSSDLVTLYYVPTDWKAKSVITTNVDELFSVTGVDATTIDVIAQDTTATKLMRFNLTELQVLSEILLDD